MKKMNFVLTGFMPLLMHADVIEEADRLEQWRRDPKNKDISRPGDDRSPPWTWHTYVYNDGTNVVMPSENIMVALRSAGTQMILKKQKTFKEITQSGLLIDGESCDFSYNDGKKLTTAFMASIRDKTFTEQAHACKEQGFTLFGKRARVGQSKHIRIRPRFDKWTVSGRIFILKEEITPAILQQLFELAGRQGLCDWRPGCKTPGPYGQFDAKVSVA